MIKAGIRGAALEGLRKALLERRDFATSGALSGRHLTAHYGLNNVRGADEEVLKADTEANGGKLFVVFSYETPIAWAGEHSDPYFVGRKFSVTTSRHQSIVRANLT